MSSFSYFSHLIWFIASQRFSWAVIKTSQMFRILLSQYIIIHSLHKCLVWQYCGSETWSYQDGSVWIHHLPKAYCLMRVRCPLLSMYLNNEWHIFGHIVYKDVRYLCWLPFWNCWICSLTRLPVTYCNNNSQLLNTILPWEQSLFWCKHPLGVSRRDWIQYIISWQNNGPKGVLFLCSRG